MKRRFLDGPLKSKNRLDSKIERLAIFLLCITFNSKFQNWLVRYETKVGFK